MSEHSRHLTGQGRFIADEAATGALTMAVLRSPVAHGEIVALSAPDGVTMITEPDLTAAGIAPLASRATITGEDGPMIEPHRPVLAEDRVLYVGQPIAAILAETEAEALDALEAITLDIDQRPAVTNPGAATPTIHDAAPGNRSFTWQKGNAEDVATLAAQAAHKIEVTVHHPRIAISPIEPRGCLATHGSQGFTLTTPSQGVVSLRTALAACMGIEPTELRVITHDVGGSFAAKIWPYPEHVLALHAARITGRPVQWIGSRSEAFTGDAAGRGRIDRGRLTLDDHGRFLTFEIDAIADMGAYLHTVSPAIVTDGAVRPFGQVYHIPGQRYRVEACFTNAVPTDAYRGAGKPESTATLERLIDVAAFRLNLDRTEIRRRNLIRPAQLPYATPMAETMDAGDFPTLLERLLAVADWPGLPGRRSVTEAKGLRHGAAIGFCVHATGGSTNERTEVRALADGTIRVRIGAQDSGQGHRQTIARITAKALDLTEDQIRVEEGDSARLEKGSGTGGSNLVAISGATTHRSALAMLDLARGQAADLLEVAEADLTYGTGTFRITGTDRTVTLAQIARSLEDDGPGCMAALDFQGTHTTWPAGALAVEVSLDPATGATQVLRTTGVTDLGWVINPDGALGQVQGGFAQSIGEALMEGMVFDQDGQPLTGSLMDYALPRADTLGPMTHTWMETAAPNTPIGAKGVGELTSIGAPGVIMNAVLDALGPAAEHVDRPLTPLKLWHALHGHRAQPKAKTQYV